MRVPSKLVGEILTAMGASPVFMNIVEAYNAVQTGVIGGVVTGTSALRGFKLGEVLRYYTDYALGVSPQFVVMNQASYDKLSPEHKKIIDETTGLNFSLKGAEVYDKEAIEQLKEEVDRGRGQEIKVSADQRAQWDRAIRPALDKAAAEHEGHRRRAHPRRHAQGEVAAASSWPPLMRALQNHSRAVPTPPASSAASRCWC